MFVIVMLKHSEKFGEERNIGAVSITSECDGKVTTYV